VFGLFRVKFEDFFVAAWPFTTDEKTCFQTV